MPPRRSKVQQVFKCCVHCPEDCPVKDKHQFHCPDCGQQVRYKHG